MGSSSSSPGCSTISFLTLKKFLEFLLNCSKISFGILYSSSKSSPFILALAFTILLTLFSSSFFSVQFQEAFFYVFFA